MKARDMIALFEYADVFKKPKPKRRVRREKFDFDDVDIEALLAKRIRQAETLKKFLEDHQKANKKEDKGNKIEFQHIERVLLLTFPIIAPLYVVWLKTLW